MGLNFAYTQYYNQSLELQALKSVTRNILTADIKAENASSKNEKAILDLYNGELDSFVAKQIALSNSGLQINTHKKVERLSNIIDEKEITDKNISSNNFFINGSVSKGYTYSNEEAIKTEWHPKSDVKESKYLFINVA